MRLHFLLKNDAWIYQNNNLTNSLICLFKLLIVYYIFVVEFNITNNKTSFSFHSYLTIKSITNKYGGEYLCKVNELNKQNSALKSIPVKVESQYLFKI